MSYSLKNSEKLFEEANQCFPGGVNSPVRAFKSVGGTPVFIKKAKGAYIWDEDGNRYIDYINSWGPAIVGHAHPDVIHTVKETMENGFSFGAPTHLETELAKKISSLMPAVEMMRFVSSGTEACMSVLRTARGYTGKNKIIKFDGCYHGHADMLLVQAGSGVATLGIPGSPGVPEGAIADTLVANFNDLESVEAHFKKFPNEIAAIIVEPMAGNANFIRPKNGFLEGLRKICDEYKSLLIFDEVMTGFRVGLGGVQGILGIRPDLTTLGKVMGGGMPIGAYGGKKEIMEKVAPAGPVYQAGTLSGNPLAVACGLKTLDLLENKYNFTELSARTNRLTLGLKEKADNAGINLSVDCEGGMFGFAFRPDAIKDFDDAKGADVETFNKFFHCMLKRGVYLAPSAFEAGFVSMTHTDEDIEATLKAAEESFQEMTS